MNPPSSPPSLAGTSASGERGRASLAGVVIVRRVRRGRDASTSDASFARDHAREEEAEETNGSPLREKRRPAGVRPFAGGARRAVGAWVGYMNLSSSSSSSFRSLRPERVRWMSAPADAAGAAGA